MTYRNLIGQRLTNCNAGDYDVKARGKTIGTLDRLVAYSDSVSHTKWIIGLV